MKVGVKGHTPRSPLVGGRTPPASIPPCHQKLQNFPSDSRCEAGHISFALAAIAWDSHLRQKQGGVESAATSISAQVTTNCFSRHEIYYKNA